MSRIPVARALRADALRILLHTISAVLVLQETDIFAGLHPSSIPTQGARDQVEVHSLARQLISDDKEPPGKSARHGNTDWDVATSS